MRTLTIVPVAALEAAKCVGSLWNRHRRHCRLADIAGAAHDARSMFGWLHQSKELRH